MENKVNFGLGLKIHLITIVAFILPAKNDFVFYIISRIGIGTFSTTGILLLIGGIKK